MTKLEQKDWHDSMRGYFAGALYNEMVDNENIIVLTGDLGYGMLDKIRADFPNRFINCGASEQGMLDISVGLSLAGKIPVVYSITTFLTYRPFETIRTYINHEKLNVKLIGGGQDKDYAHDGISHWSEDAPDVVALLSNIKSYFPQEKRDIPLLVKRMIEQSDPYFISLRR